MTGQGGGLPLSRTSFCSRPVGGRLSLFLDSWRSITRDRSVLHLLQQGRHLSFESQPLLSTSPVPFPLPEASSKREHLRAEILSMLEKGAIERVVNKSSPGFYSLMFVIPKKNGKLRLVIDLRSLNHHLRKEKFHMATPANLRHSIQKGHWVVSLDLTDAYLRVPIHPSSRKFLRFRYQEEVVTGPTLRVVGKPRSLHPCGGCDDGSCSISGFTGTPLSRRQAPEEPAAGPPQDSNPGPSSLDYSSGLDTQPGEVRVIPNSRLCLYRHILSNRSGADVPSSDPVQRSSQSCSSDSRAKYVTARDFLSLLGRLVSMSDLVPLGRLRYRPLQLYLLAHWRPSQGQLTDRIPLDHPFLDPFLKWWTKPTNVLQGDPFNLLPLGWPFTPMPPPAVGESTAAINQQQVCGQLPRQLDTSTSWSC